MASANVVATNQAAFETDVIEASMHMPVLVDFWAPWCGPCRTLMPMLERVVNSMNGTVKLAKVNTDEEQMLAQTFGIRSLPTVVLFKGGKPVDGFMGAQPEGVVRTLLAKHAAAAPQAEPEIADEITPEALDLEEQIADLTAKARAEPDKEEHRVELADLLVQTGDIEQAKALLKALSALAEGDAAKRVRARLHFAAVLDDAPNAVELQDAIAKDGKNLQARHHLAVRFLMAGQAQAAMEQWLTIVKTDRSFDNDVGRRSLLDAFRLVPDADLVSDVRKKMSAALN